MSRIYVGASDCLYTLHREGGPIKHPLGANNLNELGCYCAE